MEILVAALTVFVLAIFIGFEIITKVPPTLHTPLMSGSNAISGITVIGALLSASTGNDRLTMVLGILASLLRAEGFPPPDMWLAGETLPYYYWGALLWTVPLWVSGVPLEFGYNLIVGLIGGT